MSPLLLLLSSFYTLFCFAADSEDLQYFRDVTNHYSHSGVEYLPSPVSFDRAGRNNELIEGECAALCLQLKYICKAFVVSHGLWGRSCALFDRPIPELSIRQNNHCWSLKIYEASDRYVEPVITRFSYDRRHMSVSQWEEDLFDGYDMKHHFGHTQDILRVCRDAVIGTPSRAIDFEKWTTGTDILQSQRTSFGVRPQMMMKYINTWQEYGEWEATPENFGTIMLAFLDIFCHSISPDVVTVYDPVKEILLINYNDRYVLVASFGPGDYVVIQNKPPTQPDPKKPVILVTTPGRTTPNRDIDLVQLFQRAVTRLGSSLQFEDAEYECPHHPVGRSSSTLVLYNAIEALFLGNDDDAMVLSGSLHLRGIFYQDMVAAVISRVYGNMQPQLGSQLKAASMGNIFGDTDVLTYH